MTLAADGLENAKPYKWIYADATARASDTGFTADDVGKLAYQQSDGTYWSLKDDSPITWVAAAGGGTGDMLSTNNLSDVANAATARTNLGLGTAATHDVPASGDATATQVPLGNDSRLSDARTPTAHVASHESGGSDAFTGIVPGSAFAPAGLTGATAASRYVGATASGAPASGTFAVGDFVIDQTGKAWVCTVAGSPGTWAQLAGGGSALTVEEVDGAPTDSAVTKIVFPNGTLAIASHIATYTPSGGGSGALTKIGETLLAASAATITFSSIPGTYRSLVLDYQARGDVAANAAAVYVQINGDTGNNYDYVTGDFTTSPSGAFTPASQGRVAVVPGTTAPANYADHGRIVLPNYAATTFYKGWHATGGRVDALTGGNVYVEMTAGWWRNTAAITSLAFAPASGNFIAGTVFTLYGAS